MAQPIKKSGPFQKPRSKTVKKHTNPTKKDRRLPSKVVKVQNVKREHPKYGTSKLEERFAREFLDKLGLKYEYQYEAKSIGRFFDFRIKPYGPIIEVQGSYWHGDRRLYEEKDLNRTQKRAQYVDELKRRWCSMNGIPILYIWEKDINSDPEGVMKFLREKLKKYIDYANKDTNTSHRH